MHINGQDVNQVLYINLGTHNKWRHNCIYNDNTIRLSYVEVDHQLCLAAKWTEVEEQLKIFRNGNKRVITSDKNQIQKFYQCGEDTLWITFFMQKLWWCFAKKEVTQRTDDTTKERAVIGKWSCDNLVGEPLELKYFNQEIQEFRCQQTICELKKFKPNIVAAINTVQSPKIKDDFLEDFPELKNEKQEIVIQRIKRFQDIVVQTKNKYNNCCQFENCGFTFKKHDGSLYSEAHHLLPLSKEGSQAVDNIVILCPNHHRMLHYADVRIEDFENNRRTVKINGESCYLIYK